MKAKSPDDYLAALSEPRKSQLAALDKLIRASAPRLEPYMQGGTLGYGKVQYKYATGREGDWFRVGLASQKQYISLYVCATRDGKYLAEIYEEQLGKVNVGKSCIRFKSIADLDLAVVRKMLREAAKIT